MLHINKIAKSLDDRLRSLASLRRQLEALVQRAQTDATATIEVVASAAALDQRCIASIKQSIELYHMLALDFHWMVQLRAVANLVNAQTRIAAEHQVIAAMTERLLKSPGGTQLD
ncbi:hypothetical protein [Bradyrhizobium sp. USDA 3650]